MCGINRAFMTFHITLLWISIQLLNPILVPSVDSHVIKLNSKPDQQAKVTWGKDRVLRSLPSSQGKPLVTVVFPSDTNDTLHANERTAEVTLKFPSFSLNRLQNLKRARLNVTVSDVTARQISSLMLVGMRILTSSGESSVYLQNTQPTLPLESSNRVAIFNLTSAFNTIISQLAPIQSNNIRSRKINLFFTLRSSCETDSVNEVNPTESERDAGASCGPVLNSELGTSFLRLDSSDLSDEETSNALEKQIIFLKQIIRMRQK